MTSVDYVEEARGWALFLETEARRRTDDPDQARESVARHAKVPESTLVSLRKRRLKDIGVSKYFNLRAAVIRALQEELERHQHEIHLLHQTGVDPRSPEMEEAKAGLEKIRSALSLGT